MTVPGPVDWRRGLHDPAYFAQAVLGVTLHAGQDRWLKNSVTRENLLCTGNRWGKSFVSAVKAVHHALYRIRPARFDAGRYRIVTASITQEQAMVVYRQVLRLIDQAPLLAPLVVSRRQSPYPCLELGNGATIEARSTQRRGEYLLGQDYDLFLFDEVAFESDPEYVVEEVILMRLADRAGRLDLVSTPNGKNWFYRRARDIRERRRPGYFQTGDSRDNRHISRAYLDERVTYFSERRVQQNIMGQFVDSGGEILTGANIDAALEAGRSTTPAGAVRYISGWDLARKRTATVGITIGVYGTLCRIVALERLQEKSWTMVLERIRQRQRRFPGQLVIDGTGLGDVITEQLADYKPLSVIFTPASKAEMLTNVELFHAQGRVGYDRWELTDKSGQIWSLEDELREARWDDNNECDGLMAMALALWPLRCRSSVTPSPRVGRF